mmetsp:Transcript_100907/g.261164  ORF Transcript_100907/g.261164 Transcript_100907/m.261164 type:complete len:388 (-) Transcript_100907:7-1170(-)
MKGAVLRGCGFCLALLLILITNLPRLLYLSTSIGREKTLLALVDALKLVGVQPNPNAVLLAKTFCQDSMLRLMDEEEDLETLHVAYASDSNGFVGMMNSMLSVSRNLHRPGNAVIHLIVPDVDLGDASELVTCFRRELADLPALPQIVLHAAKELGFNVSKLDSDWILQNRLRESPSMWVRLYLDRYLPGIKRVIWLDIDTIVVADLTPLYRMHMQHAVAAAWEPPLFYKECFTKKNLPVHGDASWAFNSGVLLFDLERFASQGVVHEMEHWVKTTGGCWGDQLALNLGFQGKVDPLPWSWHVKGIGGKAMMMLQLPCLSHGKIFHWTGGDGSTKPWLPSRHRELDPLVVPYTPRAQCPALEGKSMSIPAKWDHDARGARRETRAAS